MKHFLFLIILLIAGGITAIAQTVTLPVRQSEPLYVSSKSNSFDILLGDTLILGDDLVVSGGTPPYKIHWSDPFAGLDTTINLLPVSPSDSISLNCTISDSLGCSISQVMQVNVIFPLELEIAKRDISCYEANDGAISLIISGGAQPYSIKWSNDETSNEIKGLLPGDYNATITDSYNQRIDTIISVIELPQITKSISQTICGNQTYLFNGRELSIAGEYFDTLTTVGGCDSIVMLNLQVNLAYSVSQSQSICEGNSAFFAGEELTKAGIYIDSLQTLAGCDSIITLNLAVNPSYLGSVDAEICQGETYDFRGRQLSVTGQYVDSLTTATGCDSILICNLVVHNRPERPIVTVTGDTLTATEAYAYQWYRNGEVIEGQTGSKLVIIQSGNYKIETFTEQGCINQSEEYNVTYSALDEYSSPEFALKVYPNPNKGLFIVDISTMKKEPIVLELFSVDGRLVAKKQVNEIENGLTVRFGKENLAKGTYTLKVQCGTEIVNRKLIVN